MADSEAVPPAPEPGQAEYEAIKDKNTKREIDDLASGFADCLFTAIKARAALQEAPVEATDENRKILTDNLAAAEAKGLEQIESIEAYKAAHPENADAMEYAKMQEVQEKIAKKGKSIKDAWEKIIDKKPYEEIVPGLGGMVANAPEKDQGHGRQIGTGITAAALTVAAILAARRGKNKHGADEQGNDQGNEPSNKKPRSKAKIAFAVVASVGAIIFAAETKWPNSVTNRLHIRGGQSRS